MPAFGIHIFLNEHSIAPADFARAAEERGFESMFVGEHTHMPLASSRSYPNLADPRPPQPGETSEELARRRPDLGPDFWRMYDPFIALATAAAVTSRLRLGTAICLVPERDPITLAKEVASLDRLSDGRVVLGVGSGWNPEEMANHGVRFADRFKVLRERVLAMKSIWANDVAEFHGEFVEFGPMWSFPKPVQPGGPPVLLGALSPKSYDRIADYCDGWLPNGPAPADLEERLQLLRAAAERAGRDPSSLHVSVYGPRVDGDEPAARADVQRLIDLGVDRIVFNLRNPRPERVVPLLDTYARFIEAY